MPYLWERLDGMWRKRNYRDDWDPVLTEPPSHYVPGHIWGCFFEDDFGLSVRDVIGVDIMTFETDYPHQDSTWPHSREYAQKAMASLTQDEVNRIVRSNAIDLFGLPRELTP
jgi:predicted TIM-barrel fold metal-dependent hydrolase